MGGNGEEPVETGEMNVRFNVVCHHGGEFVKLQDGDTIYRGGVSTLITEEHIETWTQQHIQNIVSGWGYVAGSFRLWTKIIELDPNYFQIRNDGDAYDLAAYACSMEVDGVLYVEHDAVTHSSSPRCVNDAGNLEVSDEEVVERMNDNEDERTTALADGFEEIDVTLPVNEGPDIAGYLTFPSKKKGDNDEYHSEELLSSDPDNSEDEKGPRFEKFKWEEFNKDFKFKWGMEFSSLDDFRGAIREWTVLNGREITFVKNERYRVRVECKAKCGFLMLCSKVGHKHTFSIKTIKDTHTCARVLDNKTASSKWVAKAVVKKMQTSDKVRICDIIQDMRQNYSVGITVCRAWKAKLIARKIIEGDADKEYANLWRYAAELHRVNPGNSVKINIDRPLPSIQPRFGSFYFCFDGCKKGFINGCRPFIGVDGCHLKTKYGGQLLIAVGRDANDQYFPLAFGVVETETKESWRWFIQLLKEDIGEDKRYVFISDQQKVGHNVKSCKSKRQNPNALKRKKRARTSAGEQGDSSVGAGTNNAESQNESTNAQSQTGTGNVEIQTGTFFGDITDDMMSSLPDMNYDVQSQASTSNLKKGKAKMDQPPTRRRKSERIKENWFKKPKPFTGPGSNPDQPICMETEEIDASKTTAMKTGKGTPKKTTPKKTTPKKTTPKKNTPKKTTPKKK